jgi:hypothetical protein
VVEGGIINRFEGQEEGMPAFKVLRFVVGVPYVRPIKYIYTHNYILPKCEHTVIQYGLNAKSHDSNTTV